MPAHMHNSFAIGRTYVDSWTVDSAGSCLGQVETDVKSGGVFLGLILILQYDFLHSRVAPSLRHQDRASKSETMLAGLGM
ncbi:hypothetical protein PAXRUDRAFT_829438 [Paxillus rubicundulus Ve08.2h10]|uniref:Uncharacterized protein n=1 Tax=Paxillus rubicundulus Ve08.2h10 TaxID=930991 RepID=A0A0D0DUV0_9AGAM|nr:hypothetical protein PAXRUDRAFT_829438 [Paxillus rubicundulus Ve08.2h10]